MMIVRAEWTGKWPCLCSGEWKLFIGDQDYSHMIPEDLRHSHMNTAGTYSDWHFEDWQEVFEDYEDGLEFEEWVAENPWVRDLPASNLDIYLSFQCQDFRPGQCGGCI